MHIKLEWILVFLVKNNGINRNIRTILPMHFVDVISSLKNTRRLIKKVNCNKMINPIINLECL